MPRHRSNYSDSDDEPHMPRDRNSGCGNPNCPIHGRHRRHDGGAGEDARAQQLRDLLAYRDQLLHNLQTGGVGGPRGLGGAGGRERHGGRGARDLVSERHGGMFAYEGLGPHGPYGGIDVYGDMDPYGPYGGMDPYGGLDPYEGMGPYGGMDPYGGRGPRGGRYF